MRDLRPDLKERIDAIESEKRALEDKILSLDNQRHLLTALLEQEIRRLGEDSPAVTPERPRLPPTIELPEIINELLETGDAWYTSQIVSVAQNRGYRFTTQHPGRSVHFTLLAMSKRGEVESAGYGRWRKKQAHHENAA